jgi:cellulose 1,4-beta-cellobiosidase
VSKRIRVLLCTVAVALAAGGTAVVAAYPAAAATTICTGNAAQSVPVAGGRFVVMNNNWGDSTTQCISATDDGFSVTSAAHNQPTNGAPGSYPAIYAGCHWGTCSDSSSGLPMQASDSRFAGVATSVNMSYPGSGVYDAAYDIWFNKSQPSPSTGQNDGAEVMIWLNHTGSIQPIGSPRATVTVAGGSWDVWFGTASGAATWNVISYVRTSPTTSASFKVDDFFQDVVARGYGQRSWWLTSVQAGFEPWVGGTGLAVNSFTYSLGGSQPTPTGSPTPCNTTGTGAGAGYWHTSGNQILDANNVPVRIAGVNWYGFETTDAVAHGLWTADYKAIMDNMKRLGYNTIRLPYSDQAVIDNVVPSNISTNGPNGTTINGDIKGLHTLDIMDKIIGYAGSIGLKVILDNHRSENGNSAEQNGLWYTGSYSESQWISNWTMLANRYKGNSTVIAADLRNEPHNPGGAPYNGNGSGATWGTGNPATDWRLAAQKAGNAVLAANPSLLVLVEGISDYQLPDGTMDADWWGGNLQGAATAPVQLNVAGRLVYSPHDYGPNLFAQTWFNSSTTPASLAAVWDKSWGYLSKQGTAPVMVGEFGTTQNASDASSSSPGSQGQWFNSLIDYLKANPAMGWTYWAYNGEDSYGLVDNNYGNTPPNGTKQSLLASIQFPLGGGGQPCPTSPPPSSPPPTSQPPTSPSPTPTGQGGTIVGRQSGRCLDIGGAGNNGDIIQIWDCHGQWNQQWVVSGNFIKNPQSGRCLAVKDNATWNGVKLQLWDCIDNGGQNWRVNSDGTVVNIATGKCLDAGGSWNGALLQIWDCGSQTNQRWTVNAPPSSPPPSPSVSPTMSPSSSPTPSNSPSPSRSATPSPTGSPTGSPPPGCAPACPHVDNPYKGATGYVNPDWSAEVMTAANAVGGTKGAAMARVANQSTAVWMDSIATITNGRGLRGHLDAALAQQQSSGQQVVATIVVYDLPNRDCAALASNGELLISQNGLARYKTDYIDVIAGIMADPKYATLRIATVVEPDSLPNLITNLSIQKCAEANSSGAYEQGIAYALDKLHAISNVYTYLDVAHSGWLGWTSNFGPAVNEFVKVARMTTAGVNSIDGFISNTANYTPTGEPWMTATQTVGGNPVRSANFYQWNDYIDEGTYATGMYNALVAAGMPAGIGMMIDTSRNGWGGAARPAGPSASTDTNTFVNDSRIDRRLHRGNWCNQSGSGLGVRPVADPAPHFDAYVWIKPPGESDGSSTSIPNNEGKSFDPMCDPTFHGSQQANGGNLTGALPNAPLSGHWFEAEFEMLVQNAYPPACLTPPRAAPSVLGAARPTTSPGASAW